MGLFSNLLSKVFGQQAAGDFLKDRREDNSAARMGLGPLPLEFIVPPQVMIPFDIEAGLRP